MGRRHPAEIRGIDGLVHMGGRLVGVGIEHHGGRKISGVLVLVIHWEVLKGELVGRAKIRDVVALGFSLQI